VVDTAVIGLSNHSDTKPLIGCLHSLANNEHCSLSIGTDINVKTNFSKCSHWQSCAQCALCVSCLLLLQISEGTALVNTDKCFLKIYQCNKLATLTITLLRL